MHITDILLVIYCFAGLVFWSLGVPGAVLFVSQLFTSHPERQRWMALAANRLGKYAGIAWLVGIVSGFAAWLTGGQIL